MSTDSALVKILEGRGEDLNHFLSAFPTQLLLRTVMVKGTAGGASGRMEFIGYALPGTAKTQARWLIKKLVYDSDGFQIDSIFADGEAKFNKVFDTGASEYADYTFSVS